jgi:hypothetical protein
MIELVLCQVTASPEPAQGGLLEGRATTLLMIGLGLLGFVAIAILFARKRRLQKTVEERFSVFRKQAVSLMDELDSLRKRHKTLPLQDPDFTVPMTGATLALYGQVNRDLDELWERWLEVMEIWDQTQQRIRTGSGLAQKPTEEARKLMDGGKIEELVRQSRLCKEQLDRLNQAHERARATLASTRCELAEIQHALTKGTGVLLPSDLHHREIEGAETTLAEAEMTLAADPLGALEQIDRTQRSLSSLTDRPPRGHAGLFPASPFHPLLDELSAAAERLRAAAGRLRVTDLLGLALKAWVALWILGLVFSLMLPLLVPFVLVAVMVLMMACAWHVFRVMLSWLSFGPRR